MKKLVGTGLLLLSVAGLEGCGANNFVNPPTIQTFSVLNTRVSTGTVVLPAGSTLSPNKVSVISSVSTSVTPSASGSFSLTTYDDGTEMGIVLSPGGNPMLMGFLDANDKTLSADSTALTLAFFALGGHLTLNESDRTQLLAQISALPAFPALSKAIATEIAANPDAFAQRDTNVTNAIDTFFTAVTGVTPIQLTASGAHPASVLINPTNSQSGVSVIENPPSSANMMNNYRRRTHTFVSRVSDTLGTSTTSDAADVTDFELAPANGLTGGVTGTVTQIFNAYFGNSATAYAPVSSSPFSVPLTSGFDKTTYTVLNVGPGGMGQSQLSTLTSAQHTILVQTSINGLVNDALIPFFSNVAFGSGFLPDLSNTSAAGQANFRTAFVNNVEKDILGLITTLPATQTKILAGDYHGALNDLIFNTANSATLRGLLLQAASDAAAEQHVPQVPLTNMLAKFNVIMGAAGGVLQVLDTAVYNAQLLSSDVVDSWTLVSSNSKAVLSPPTSTLSGAGTILLTATVPGVTLAGNNYSFMWTDTATAGTLSEVGGGGRTAQTSYCSSSAQANYVLTAAQAAALTGQVTDTINVAVYSGSSCVPANAVGASASATVTVQTGGLQNGDFSQGLSFWNQTNGGFSIGTNVDYNGQVCLPSKEGNPFALGAAYGSDISLEQSFTVPAGAKTLSLTTWNNLDPVQVTISMIANGSETVLGSLQPPSMQMLSNPNNYYSVVCTGNAPASLSYPISQFAGKGVTLRLRAAYIGGINGTFGSFDDVVVK